MTDQEDFAAKGRQRGRGFPVWALPRVVDALRDVVRYGMRQSRPAFAERLGHQTPASGPFRQKLAAFREFGLVTTRGEDIVLTDLGQQVAVPVDRTSERRAVRAAFFECRLFAELYGVLAKDSDLELRAIAATAFHQFGVAAGSRELCATTFSDSAKFAGLADPGANGTVRLLEAEDEIVQPEIIDGGRESLRDASASVPLVDSYRTNIELEHPLLDGRLTLRVQLRRALPLHAFKAMQSAAEAVEELAKQLGMEDD